MALPLRVLAAAGRTSTAALEVLARSGALADHVEIAGLTSHPAAREWVSTHSRPEVVALGLLDALLRARARDLSARLAEVLGDPVALRGLAAGLASTTHPLLATRKRGLRDVRLRVLSEGVVDLTTLPALLLLASSVCDGRSLVLARAAAWAREDGDRAAGVLEAARAQGWAGPLVRHLGPWEHCGLEAREEGWFHRGLLDRLLSTLPDHLRLGSDDSPPSVLEASPEELSSEQARVIARLVTDTDLRRALACRVLVGADDLDLAAARERVLGLRGHLARAGVVLTRDETLAAAASRYSHELDARVLAHLLAEGEWVSPPEDPELALAWVRDAIERGGVGVTETLTALHSQGGVDTDLLTDLTARAVVDPRLPWAELEALALLLDTGVDGWVASIPATDEGDARFAQLAALVPYVCDADDLRARRRPATTARAVMRGLCEGRRWAGSIHHSHAFLACASVVRLHHREVLALPWELAGVSLGERVGEVLARELSDDVRAWEVLTGLAETFEGSVGELVEASRALLR